MSVHKYLYHNKNHFNTLPLLILLLQTKIVAIILLYKLIPLYNINLCVHLPCKHTFGFVLIQL